MPEFIVTIKDTGNRTVAETFVSGDTAQDVLMSIREEVSAAENGDSDWADGIEEAFSDTLTLSGGRSG
jgi:hypothetical protein